MKKRRKNWKFVIAGVPIEQYRTIICRSESLSSWQILKKRKNNWKFGIDGGDREQYQPFTGLNLSVVSWLVFLLLKKEKE